MKIWQVIVAVMAFGWRNQKKWHKKIDKKKFAKNPITQALPGRYPLSIKEGIASDRWRRGGHRAV
jgi:hypothetical protein